MSIKIGIYLSMYCHINVKNACGNAISSYDVEMYVDYYLQYFIYSTYNKI